jgi:AcrR family transcriptional regulator
MKRSPWISDLRWVRPARQARSRRTRSLLLDAAEAVISEKGVDDTGVADVAARAGCSVGAVYHHFRDKHALVYALIDRMGDEFRATMRDAVDPERWEGAAISEILEAYLQFSLEVGRERPGMRRAQLVMALRDPKVREHMSELRRELDQSLANLLIARREEVGHADPELATAFVLEQLRSMLVVRLDETLSFGVESTSDEGFVREAIASVCAYLRIPPSPIPEDLS